MNDREAALETIAHLERLAGRAGEALTEGRTEAAMVIASITLAATMVEIYKLLDRVTRHGDALDTREVSR